MSDNIQNMDVKRLRNEVQLLRDELAIMQRKYEDILYNLDDDNFSSKLLKEKDNMKTQIEITAEGIKTTVEDIEGLSSEISQTSNRISAVVRGDYTENMLNGYFTGIVISPNQIKMIDNGVYSAYNSDGLKFYDSTDQVEGWAIEPASDYGGVLNYYVNDGLSYSFGARPSEEYSDCISRGYAYTDMCLKAYGQRGRFVVDVNDSDNKEALFVGLYDWSTNDDTPRILANGHLLATQKWVKANGGGEARFG